uniref:Uncharacterized protein n=1 Tax=Vespula pensylvanica TaxID=30213 RepID=A0A834UH96_VESPE|nr:hypothetical protein H0235_001293 [Vespula pensylvanica]
MDDKGLTMRSNASIVKIAANIAACILNEGATAYLLLMHSLNIDIGRNCVPYFEYQDRERIDSDEIQTQDATREGEFLADINNSLPMKQQLLLRILYRILELMTRDKVKDSLR